MDDYGLIQVMEESTRGKNTLDLLFTNEVSFIRQIEVMKSSMSDHDRIEIMTDIKS